MASLYAQAIGGVARFASPRRIRIYTRLMLVAVVLVGALDAASVSRRPERAGNALGGDFLAFYTGAQFLRQGRMAEVYDLAAQREFQRRVVAPRKLAAKPFINPPHAAVLYLPFALSGHATGLALWSLAGLAALLGSARLLCGELDALRRLGPLRLAAASFLFFPTLAWLGFGQATGFVLLLYTATFVLLRRGRDLAAGACLGCLAFKPQLALGLAVVLLLNGRSRALLGGAAAAAGWLALGFRLSPEATQRYLRLGPELVALLRSDAYPGWGIHSALGFASLLLDGFSPRLADALATALCAAALAALGLAWWRIEWRPGSRAWDLAMAGSLALGLLLSPHLYFYDLMLLLLPLALVWQHHPELRDGRPLDGGALLAWTAVLWALGFLGTPLSLAQLRLAEAIGLPGFAVQL
ncbi:MAG TPA: glycosyltransferase family 87 protein, partial [Myxococcota bacterium]|nr:glycosyltransferase family 87 protein [Myxococcota bacterium]